MSAQAEALAGLSRPRIAEVGLRRTWAGDFFYLLGRSGPQAAVSGDYRDIEAAYHTV